MVVLKAGKQTEAETFFGKNGGLGLYLDASQGVYYGTHLMGAVDESMQFRAGDSLVDKDLNENMTYARKVFPDLHVESIIGDLYSLELNKPVNHEEDRDSDMEEEESDNKGFRSNGKTVFFAMRLVGQPAVRFAQLTTHIDQLHGVSVGDEVNAQEFKLVKKEGAKYDWDMEKIPDEKVTCTMRDIYSDGTCFVQQGSKWNLIEKVKSSIGKPDQIARIVEDGSIYLKKGCSWSGGSSMCGGGFLVVEGEFRLPPFKQFLKWVSD